MLRVLQKVSDDKAVSQKKVYERYKDIKEGRERDQNERCPGRPSTSIDKTHVKEINDLVLTNIT
ncbi:hypothetical protein NECAME_09528 [Necator americanus]|uniref:Uncharacterized protein n=1 Tax=Necator americanus TaxID=51031 RepID=W2TDL4_NECAM|nr:hypothetical protein NECAME_09528 [Necator americanus]ETN79918.1 hypothetical protein NECAME_09528 [Necator americanus]